MCIKFLSNCPPIRLDVPNADGLVVAARNDAAAVELHAADAAGVALEGSHVALRRNSIEKI